MGRSALGHLRFERTATSVSIDLETCSLRYFSSESPKPSSEWTHTKRVVTTGIAGSLSGSRRKNVAAILVHLWHMCPYFYIRGQFSLCLEVELFTGADNS